MRGLGVDVKGEITGLGKRSIKQIYICRRIESAYQNAAAEIRVKQINITQENWIDTTIEIIAIYIS
jgi:hypothetical protein